ncbi:MAG: hypothetical protein CL776_03570 [Chloroflexi bacterium]|nr:hypothetical protein [Chloroflexota bacterium]|tara:strand:- start:431 stop:1906 length:1476 start_codon:yes stop_codon:yes gene_type:complete
MPWIFSKKVNLQTQNTASSTFTKKNTLVVIVVGIALLVSSMNLTVGFVVLPQMMEGLDVGLNWVGWTITSYQLSSSIAMSLFGRISDQLGRRKIFALSLLVFTIGSVGSALAPNIGFHILMRVIAAVGSGAILPISAAIVSIEFPRHRAKALGLFTTILPIGWILGPTLGGFIADSLSWRVSFILVVPFSILALIGTMVVVPESYQRTALSKLDLKGAFLLAISIGAFMLSLSLFRVTTDTAMIFAWILLMITIPLGFIFWKHELRADDPIVDLELLRLRPFMAANTYNIVWGGTSIGSSAFIPFYATIQFGLDSSRSGAMLIGLEIALIISSTVVSLWLLRRLGYRVLLLAGGFVLSGSLLVVGFGIFSLLENYIAPFWTLFIVLTIAGIGMGIQSPASNNAGVELMPSRVSSIVGLRGTFRFGGSVISTTLIFFVLAGFENKATGVEFVYLALGAILLLAMPIIFIMPTGREEPIDGSSSTTPVSRTQT